MDHPPAGVDAASSTKKAFTAVMSDRWVSAVAIRPSRTVQTVARCSSRSTDPWAVPFVLRRTALLLRAISGGGVAAGFPVVAAIFLSVTMLARGGATRHASSRQAPVVAHAATPGVQADAKSARPDRGWSDAGFNLFIVRRSDPHGSWYAVSLGAAPRPDRARSGPVAKHERRRSAQNSDILSQPSRSATSM